MGKGMTNRRIKRTMALLLTVTMLPFADYAQAFAYSGQRTSAGLDLQQTAVSSNAVKQNGEDSLDSLNESNKETLDASGNNTVANEPWVRITPEEVEAIKLAEITQYDDMTVEEDAYVLEEDMEVGNLHINGESLDLNGHTLIVYGTLLQSAGEISLNGGKLVVGQDYRIQTREENSEWNQENELYLYKAGSGKLVMTNANDYLVVCGSFVTDSNVSHEGSLTAGIMEVMGDFTQLCSENEANFVATENHKIVFNSAEGQTVFMNSTGVDKSRFANMELGFVSEEGSGTNGEKPEILFGGNPYVSGQVNDTKSHKVSGKIGVGSATTLVEGYFGGGASILQEIQVPENETITFGGDMDILAKVSVYGILNAEGNVTVTETGISMEGGRLWVGKNFTVTSENYNNPSWGMKMSHEEDYVLVEGDFCYQAGSEMELSNGTLEIKQNAVIEKGFHGKGSHKTVFSGEKKQTIAMAAGMYFHILELKNQSEEGIYSETILQKSQLIRNGSKLSYGSLEGSCGYTLEQDEVIEGDFILVDDTLDLNGHSLRIKGDLIHVSGTILVDGGLLTVEGDYKQQSDIGCNGYLEMTQDKDHVLVKGSMYVETTADTTGKLTNGVLEIQGDFIQKKTEGLNNFLAANNHTLLFSGEEKQTLTMEYTGIKNSQIANLEVRNAKGIEITNSPYVAGLVVTSGYPVTGQISIGSTTGFVGGAFPGDVCILQAYNIDQDMMNSRNLER